MKCANCDTAALYIYNITPSKAVLYCGKHLPRFLEARRKAGLLALTAAHKEQLDSALASLSKSKKSKKKIEEPVVEEPTEEPLAEPVVEEPVAEPEVVEPVEEPKVEEEKTSE